MANYYSCSSTNHRNVDSCQGKVLIAKHVVAVVNRAKFTSDSSLDASEVIAQRTCSSEGQRSFEYTYLKSNLNSLKQVQVFWSGCPNMMEKNYISADYYYYLPSTPVAIYICLKFN